VVLRLGYLPQVMFHPTEQCGRQEVVTTLSIPRSPPRSGALIAVVAGCHWTSLSPLSEVLPLPATEADQVSLVASLLGNEWANHR
jgi:hypothetical protein